jgi:hypothetical protein
MFSAKPLLKRIAFEKFDLISVHVCNGNLKHVMPFYSSKIQFYCSKICEFSLKRNVDNPDYNYNCVSCVYFRKYKRTLRDLTYST